MLLPFAANSGFRDGTGEHFLRVMHDDLVLK
jgi:hypothetical protein